MTEQEEKSREYFTPDGQISIDEMARKLRNHLIELKQEPPTDEDGILGVFAGYDRAAHITDAMGEEELGEFLDSFVDAFKKAE